MSFCHRINGFTTPRAAPSITPGGADLGLHVYSSVVGDELSARVHRVIAAGGVWAGYSVGATG